MKHFISMIILTSTLFMAQSQSAENKVTEINKWIGAWEQTNLYSKSVKKECRIDQFLKFRYVIEKGINSDLEGVIIQTDYRFNITSPPNPACEFKDTQSANVLHNVKKWKTTIDYNEQDNTLIVKGHSGECLNDHCKSSEEGGFETKIVLGDGYLIDDFGTANAADDIYLLSDAKRNFLLSEAKKIALQVEKNIKEKNCSGIYDMLKKNNRKKLTEDYIETCTKSYKSKPSVNSFLTVDQFLSFNRDGNHWAIFVNNVMYQDKTEKRELMYLVHEDNVWKFWGVYP